MEDTVRVAVVGAGFMGRAHARVLSRIGEELPGSIELSYIVDTLYDNALLASRKFGGKPVKSVDEIEGNSVDFAVIAIPTSLHMQVFEQLVNKGVNGFLIEKPLTNTISSSARLADIAGDMDLWVSVGHIERFNPAVQSFHRRLGRGELGKVLTYLARRVGPYTPRVADVDVVYDLGVHETDNVLTVFKSLPSRVRSYTIKGLVSGLTDHSLGIFSYADRGFASIEVNRITPFKLRIMYLTTTKGVVFLDYMKQELKLYKGDEETSVNVKKEEPLYLEDLETIKRYMEKKDPPVDVYQAIASVYLCDKILESTESDKEIVIEESPDYQDLKDYLNRGLIGYNNYINGLSAKFP
ncbi:MAG: Gfo/Idh/MocA family oxidoreductase [Desulfurococcales archaeon]|nr:Gfo/Idh/MocA family oxidoreductase [Desulfurococcales archaeon]